MKAINSKSQINVKEVLYNLHYLADNVDSLEDIIFNNAKEISDLTLAQISASVNIANNIINEVLSAVTPYNNGINVKSSPFKD